MPRVDLDGLSPRDIDQLAQHAALLRDRNRGGSCETASPARVAAAILDRASDDFTKHAELTQSRMSMATPAMPLSLDNVVDAFTYHPWERDQVDAGAQVVEALIAAAKVILRVVPAGADRTVALRKLREARMDANSAITHRGRF